MPLPRLSALPRRPGVYVAPGAMDQWIEILAPGHQNPADGTPLPPSPVFTGWADVTRLSGQELLRAQQIVQQVTHEVVINSPQVEGDAQAALIPESGLVRFDGRIMEIQNISDPDERNFQLHILCVERNQNP